MAYSLTRYSPYYYDPVLVSTYTDEYYRMKESLRSNQMAVERMIDSVRDVSNCFRFLLVDCFLYCVFCFLSLLFLLFGLFFIWFLFLFLFFSISFLFVCTNFLCFLFPFFRFLSFCSSSISFVLIIFCLLFRLLSFMFFFCLLSLSFIVFSQFLLVLLLFFFYSGRRKKGIHRWKQKQYFGSFNFRNETEPFTTPTWSVPCCKAVLMPMLPGSTTLSRTLLPGRTDSPTCTLGLITSRLLWTARITAWKRWDICYLRSKRRQNSE